MGRTVRLGSGRGFTLIELLVVIAIIAILAAILFPVFARAKETSKVTKCINNLKQIGVGITTYIDDNSGKFPPAANFGTEAYNNANGQPTLLQCIRTYTKTVIARDNTTNSGKPYSSVGIFACPGDVGFPDDQSLGEPAGLKRGIAIWKQCGCSYDYCAPNQTDWANSRGKGSASYEWSGLAPVVDVSGTRTALGAPMSAIRTPSRKGMLSDCWNWHMGESGDGMGSAHRNTVFADGHATRTWFKDWCYTRTEQLSKWHNYRVL